MDDQPPARVRTSRHRRWWWALTLLGAAWAAVLWGNDVAVALESDAPSRSIGTPELGRLANGKRLPSRGGNFQVYSSLGAMLGRNAVHDPVRRTVVQAYGALERSHPRYRFVYGETGWSSGGPFPPHKTHQNGMAVDFFVPVSDASGEPRFLPTSPFNKFGYDIEFDDNGRWETYTIDFEALAAHLHALAEASRVNELRVDLVIFDPALQRRLFATAAGKTLAKALPFSPTPSWVRHDEHYHVVFGGN